MREREGVGIECGLEVAEVEGVAEPEGTPEEPRFLPLNPSWYETDNQVQIPAIEHVNCNVEIKSSS
jgi:hypothetical protein